MIFYCLFLDLRFLISKFYVNSIVQQTKGKINSLRMGTPQPQKRKERKENRLIQNQCEKLK